MGWDVVVWIGVLWCGVVVELGVRSVGEVYGEGRGWRGKVYLRRGCS